MTPHSPAEEGRRYALDLAAALEDIRFPLSREEFLERIRGRVVTFHDGRRLNLYDALKHTQDSRFTSLRDVATDLVLRGAFRADTTPRPPPAVEGAAEGATGEPMTEGEGGPNVAGGHRPTP